MYDAQALPILESEARAAGHYLARVLEPVQQHQAAALAGFDLLTTPPEEAQRYQATERLVAALQAYGAAVVAYNQQLEANLAEAIATAQREASRAAFFLQEFRLTHADLLKEQQLQVQQLETFQTLLRRAA
jgi:hypothetical protein